MRTHHSPFELDGSGSGRRKMGQWAPYYLLVFCLGVRPASSVFKVARRSGPVAYIVNRSKQSGYVVLHTLITLVKHKHSYPVQVQYNI